MKFALPAVFLSVFFFLSGGASAQSQQEDSIFYQAALSHTISVYYSQLGDQSQLYNGSLYPGYDFKFREGSPYFLTDKFTGGSVVYDGILFDSLSLLYDDLKRVLVSKSDGFVLQFVSERISEFTVSGHHFVRLKADSTNQGLSETGFYEILYPGRSRVLKETFKKTREVPSIYEGLLHYVDETTDYFIRTANGYKPANSKGEILQVFKDHKKEVQQYMKKNKLKFRSDKENTLIEVAGYYDQIAK
jgi:hypothetical protein